jgi:hypothetical protein
MVLKIGETREYYSTFRANQKGDCSVAKVDLEVSGANFRTRARHLPLDEESVDQMTLPAN